MGTIEKYWNAIPNVQASTKSATYMAMRVFGASAAKIAIDQPVRSKWRRRWRAADPASGFALGRRREDP
jgi:hypothetical protein